MNNKFFYIKDFLTNEELEVAHKYSIYRHKNNTTDFDDKVNGATRFYSDPLMEILLEKKLPLVEKIVNKKLFPTYSYLRFYHKYTDLKKHTDRNSCEISVTCTLGRDKSWPIFIDGESVDVKPGDGVLYYGAKYEHWREEYDGDYCSQVFFHYIDQEGKNKDFKFDKRQSLGFQR